MSPSAIGDLQRYESLPHSVTNDLSQLGVLISSHQSLHSQHQLFTQKLLGKLVRVALILGGK